MTDVDSPSWNELLGTLERQLKKESERIRELKAEVARRDILISAVKVWADEIHRKAGGLTVALNSTWVTPEAKIVLRALDTYRHPEGEPTAEALPDGWVLCPKGCGRPVRVDARKDNRAHVCY